jgi:hypothetical protein
MKKNAKVVVGFPAGGSVTVPFHASMTRLLTREILKGDDCLIGQLTYTSGLYIADNRQVLAKRFLASGAEWLLQVDTDIEFPPTLLEDLLRLAGEDKKILAASVPLGTAVILGDEGGYRHGFPTCAFNMIPNQPGVWISLESVPQAPIECDGVATAVVLTHRDVFREIARRHGQTWFHHIYIPKSADAKKGEALEYHTQGEDLAFCVRAKAAGFKVWCVTLPGLRHHKTSPQTHDAAAERATTEDILIAQGEVLAGGER